MKFTRVEIDNFYNLKNVDLDLSNGIALIVGPNGSGKSNIIKCIDFLVQCALGTERDDGLRIWDVNQPKCRIKLDAVLTKDEVRLISSLRLCYLVLVVGLVVAQIANERETPYGNFYSAGRVQLTSAHSPCAELIGKAYNELIPNLMEITEASSAEEPFRDSSNVSIRVETRVVQCVELDRFYHLNMHFQSQKQMEKEKECILATLRNLFGEFSQEESKIGITLEKKISDLVADKEWHLNNNIKSSGLSYSSLADAFNLMRKSPAVPYSMHDLSEPIYTFAWRSIPKIKSVAEKIYFLPASYFSSSFEIEIVKHLLENSFCILPQSTQVLETEDKFLLDTRKAERMLIEASISENHQKQDRFACVENALKSFCGLVIHVSKKQFDSRHADNAIEHELVAFAYDCAGADKGMHRHLGIPVRAEERLLDIAKKVGQQERKKPSWTGALQVLVTRTMPTDGPPYSITTPLSELSGGEIELLMTLCAVHLSGADTVFLDEPGHSLHPPMQAQLRRWLETQRPRDQVCVVVSHSTEFVSPQSLRCLYHMSFVGRGFTPFRLRLVGHDASLTEMTTSDKTKESASVKEVKTPDPSDDRNLPDKDTQSVSSEEDQNSGPSGNITTSDNNEQELASTRKEEHTSPSSSNGSALKKYQESASEKKVQASESEVTLTEESVTMLMRPDMRKMFFATGLYFVEGESDKRVLSALRHIFMEEASDIMETSRDSKKIYQAMNVQEMDRWDILTLGGCGDAVKAYKAATELKIPCAVVLDIDAITVKHGRQVQPFNEANWKKSKLFKGLRGKIEKEKKDKDKDKDKDSLPFAQNLLAEVENVFQEAANPEDVLKYARDALKTQGFFIWKSDLESAVICDNSKMKDKLLEMKNFLKVVGENPVCSSSHDDCEPMSAEDAKKSYEEHVLEKLLPLAQGLVDELEGARDRIAKYPTESVTVKALDLIKEINKNKQVLSNHDKHVTKGSKGKGKNRVKDSGTGKQGTSVVKSRTTEVEESSSFSEAPSTSSDKTVEGQQATRAENEAPTSRKQFGTEAQERRFWTCVKRKLHDEGGWTKMPWETLTEVVRVCLQSQPSPLADLCRFMKQTQGKGKKKRNREFPKELLSRFLSSMDDDDNMDDYSF